jgi:acyl-CoA thioesterase
MTYLDEISLQGRDANPFFRMMGIGIVSYGRGEAVLEMEVTPDMMNGDGWLQGGIYTALADEAMALALVTVMEENESIATVSETTSFYRGVREGRLRAEGRVVRKGRKIAFAEGRLFLEGDEPAILSKSDASFAVLRR